MATPHVAGIAALHIHANPGITAAECFGLLSIKARRLPQLSVDVGAGLARAPLA
jgi:subtilisin